MKQITQDTQDTAKRFKYWQWRVIFCSMVGYAMFYFVRKNFSFAIPLLQQEYGITNADFGIILTAGGVLYGVSKFVNGIIADRANARWHLVIGLAVCVVINFIFGWSAKLSAMFFGGEGPDFVGGIVTVMGILYIINQIFQGCGYAPCNRLLVSWVPPTELATKLGFWNVSHSIGASVAAVICGYLTSWQLCFWIPAMIAFFGVFFIIVTLRDTPSSVGLPELESTKTDLDKNDDRKAYRAFLMKKVFKNPIIWVAAFTDLFVYIVRFAVLDWGPTFLQKMGLSGELSGWTVAIFELAGCAGMMFAGWVSDHVFHSKTQRVCAIEMFLVALCLVALYFLQDSSNAVLFLVVLAIAGFFLYGPQALLAVVACNHATKKAASSAVGLVGFMGYVSTIFTGWGVGIISDNFGWHPLFAIMAVVAVMGGVLISTIWNVGSHSYNQD